ncbi:MAG: hypothetical protein IJ574_03060 [Bacilli bacterium]|nr:hypothetical protein [Bacilli bacterium]
MNNNKEILKYCPNYYKIVNTDYTEDDIITEKIIKIYENYVCKINSNNLDELNKLKVFDTAINKYIEDNMFRKEMKEKILTLRVKKTGDVLRNIVDSIIDIFENYIMFATRKINISRWI